MGLAPIKTQAPVCIPIGGLEFSKPVLEHFLDGRGYVHITRFPVALADRALSPMLVYGLTFRQPWLGLKTLVAWASSAVSGPRSAS